MAFRFGYNFKGRSSIFYTVLFIALGFHVNTSWGAPLETNTENTTNSSIISIDLQGSEDRTKVERSTPLENSSSKPDVMTQIQYQLVENQKNLLRLVGLVDRAWENFGEMLRNTTFSIVLDGQKAFGKAYHSFPPFVNPLIQRVGALFGTSGDQLNQVIFTRRANVKAFIDNWDDHEHDFHEVFKDRFETINQDLGVQPLPNYNFTWT